MIKSTLNKGFQMKFENGLEISVQFGMGNYCDNRYNKEYIVDGICESKNAEIAVFNKNNDYVTAEVLGVNMCDYVIAYVTADSIADMIYKVKNYEK